jgi:hypothetical protein
VLGGWARQRAWCWWCSGSEMRMMFLIPPLQDQMTPPDSGLALTPRFFQNRPAVTENRSVTSRCGALRGSGLHYPLGASMASRGPWEGQLQARDRQGKQTALVGHLDHGFCVWCFPCWRQEVGTTAAAQRCGGW